MGFIFAVGMVVAFVPEGLLPTVTLALAMGVQRMARRNALIKKLSAVETLGACTVICTDKTGTLTQNEMTVREAWTAGRRWRASGGGYDPAGEFRLADGPADGAARGPARAARRGGALQQRPAPAPRARGAAGRSSATRRRPRCWSPRPRAALDEAALARELPRSRELPFDSRRKRMSTVHTRRRRARIAYVKGAPREVLELCTAILVDGTEAPLDAAARARILAVNDEYARGALRVLAVARRELPPRPEADHRRVGGARAHAARAGGDDGPAAPRGRRGGRHLPARRHPHHMVTGDYGLTAESIARRVGIVGEGARIVTGQDLDAMTDEGLAEVLRGEVIFARVAPEHKLRVVTALQALGEVVAVTGDGVNDAPALRKADIGDRDGHRGHGRRQGGGPDDPARRQLRLDRQRHRGGARRLRQHPQVHDLHLHEQHPGGLAVHPADPLQRPARAARDADPRRRPRHGHPAGARARDGEAGAGADGPPAAQPAASGSSTARCILRSLLWLGSIQTLLCFAGFFFFYWTMGYRDLLHLPRPDLLPYGERLLSKDGLVYVMATSMFHAGVVATQIGNAYACRTERSSVFAVGFWGNRLLLAGFAAELVLMAAC